MQRRKLISEAREIFCDTEVKKNIFGKKNVNSIEKEPADIRETIKKTEAIIKEKKAEIKKIRGKTNQSNILRKPETTEIKEYLSWCEKNGVKPVATKVIKKRLATFGRGALRLGATPLMIFLTIHNIESAPPEKRNEAIAENAASLASFYIALKFGTAAFKTIPGPLLNKAVGSVSVAMLSFFVGQKSIDEFSSKILKKINLDFSEGSATDDVLLGLETVFGLGGSLGFIKNLFHTGENAKQFLERDIPALFHKGEFISRFHYNSVGTWNKRIQKRISETTSLPKKVFYKPF